MGLRCATISAVPRNSEPRMRRALRVLLLLFAVFVLVSVITIATHRNPAAKGAKAPINATTTSTAATVIPTTGTGGANSPGASGKATTTTTAPIRYIAFDIQHGGDDTIGPFVISTIASQWNLSWTYRCPKLTTNRGFDYVVDYKQGARRDLNDLGPNEHAGSGSGTEHYYDAGSFDLSVTSHCLWTIKVTEVVP